jgi:hypothetical protein
LIEAALARMPASESFSSRAATHDTVSEAQAALDVHAFDATHVLQIDSTLPDRERVAPFVNALVAAYRDRLVRSFATHPAIH